MLNPIRFDSTSLNSVLASRVECDVGWDRIPLHVGCGMTWVDIDLASTYLRKATDAQWIAWRRLVRANMDQLNLSRTHAGVIIKAHQTFNDPSTILHIHTHTRTSAYQPFACKTIEQCARLCTPRNSNNTYTVVLIFMMIKWSNGERLITSSVNSFIRPSCMSRLNLTISALRRPTFVTPHLNCAFCTEGESSKFQRHIHAVYLFFSW